MFPGARQVFRLRRDTDGVRTIKENIHGIVGLNADLAGPQHLNAYARGHWTVENRLHWTRDVTFGEGRTYRNNARAVHSYRDGRLLNAV